MRFIEAYTTMCPDPGYPFSVTQQAAAQRFFDKGPEAFYQQDQGKASDPQNAVFQRKWFPVIDTLDHNKILFVAMSGDTSMGKDPLALLTGLVMNDGTIVIADCFQESIAFGAQKRVIRAKYELMWRRFQKQPLLILEKASSAEPIFSDLREEMGNQLVCELHPAHKSKHQRYLAVQGQVMSGAVLMWRHCPMLEIMLRDLANAPYDSANDHIPDAFCQLVSHVKRQHIQLGSEDHRLLSSGNSVAEFAAELFSQQSWENEVSIWGPDDDGEGDAFYK
jgi:phage terminase large subunit-like protein